MAINGVRFQVKQHQAMVSCKLQLFISCILARGFFGQQQQQETPENEVQAGAWNGSLLDNLNNQFQLRNVSLLLRSYCGQEIQRVLNNRTANLTFFAPSDKGLSQLFDMSARMGAAEFNCSTSGKNGSEIGKYCDPNSWPVNLQNVSFYNVSACSPLILQYHVVPDERLNLTQSQSKQPSNMTFGLGSFVARQSPFQQNQQQGSQQPEQTLNVTVLRTMLNDTRFVQLPQNQSQVLILNQTSTGYYLRHGAWPEARVFVNQTINGTNGVAYIIDRPLLPPLNLTRSLQMLNLTKFAQAMNQNQNSSSPMQGQGQSYSNMTGITVFAPIDSAVNGQNSSQQFNVSSYIIPDQVIYNNRTSQQNSSISVQAMDGQAYNISFGQNFTMMYGNASVVESNILLSNGVLHIINGTVSGEGQSQQNQTSASPVGISAIAC